MDKKEIKKKKPLKIVLIVVGVIVLVFIALVVGVIVSDFKQEALIKEDAQEISDIMMASEFDEAKLKAKLDTRVSKGDYAKVERAYKTFIKDYLRILDTIVDFYTTFDLSNTLTSENIAADGKNFIATKYMLKSTKESLNRLKSEFDAFLTEENVMSYIEKEKFDSPEYYIDFYKNYIIGEITVSKEITDLSEELKSTIDLITNVETTIKFLSDNQSHWELGADGKIYFDSEKLVDEYNKLLENL